MAEHSKAALNFLEALTAYLMWRANGRNPPGFNVDTHMDAFAQYIETCGIGRGSPLHQPLVEFMAAMERTPPPPDTPLPTT